MNLIQHLDFILKLFILGGIPWLFLSKEDSLYFKIRGINLAVIFNCFASLFASSIYISIYYSKPDYWKSELVFFYWAIPFAILYFIILFDKYENIAEDSKKDSYFEIEKLKAISQKSDEQIKILEELRRKKCRIKFLVILHFTIYLAFFILLAFALGISSIIQLRKIIGS